MQKFLPAGSLSLEVQPNSDGTPRHIVIPENISIEATIIRKFWPSTQTARFRIYNLGEETRRAIFWDPFNWTLPEAPLARAIQFRAGYGSFTPLIFNGQIQAAYSQKEGNTEVVTVIEAFDGGLSFVNGFTSATVAGGTTSSQIISQLGAPGSLPGVTSDAIVGDFPETNSRGEVLFGNTWDLILQKSGGNATIDNGQVKALKPNEAISANQILLVSSATGLLGSPRRTGTMVEWDMIFEPQLSLAQLVNIQSLINPQFNGINKIMGFTHQVMISKAVDGQRMTTANFLWFPNGTSSSSIPGISVANP